MPTRYKDYPIYSYDEPSTQDDFTGGINTDPSNEHLLDNEMRDCVNMTYLSGALVKRKGASLLSSIECNEDIFNVQGVFLFTLNITYIIIAADGKLYQGIYNDNTTINLNRLYIYNKIEETDKMYDELDCFSGIETMLSNQIPEKHEGVAVIKYKNIYTEEEYEPRDSGSYSERSDGMISKGEIFDGIYMASTDFEKTTIYPTNTNFWEEISTSSNVKEWSDGTSVHTMGEQVLYKSKTYRCIYPHTNLSNALSDTRFFISLYDTRLVKNKYLRFQNYKKIEAATLNNKLYIATGTRIVEVSVNDGVLDAHLIEPYAINGTEMTKIGYNYMSPYPEYAMASESDTVSTSIFGVKVTKMNNGKFVLTPLMTFQIGENSDDYCFRWEKYINGSWHVLIRYNENFVSRIANSSSSNELVEPIDYSSIEVDDADKYRYRCLFAKSFVASTEIVDAWILPTSTTVYSFNDLRSVDAHVYRCVYEHSSTTIQYAGDGISFNKYGYKINEDGTVDTSKLIELWVDVNEYEMVNVLYKEDGKYKTKYMYDWIVDDVAGSYFGSATSVIFDNDISVSDKFLLINSCTSVLADGNKLIYYNDRYNSGEWFKTIISNPSYITDRGGLSFKTTKNEGIVKVIPFQGNIIVFANSDNIGGSIHMVTGNGDDYDASDGYYSPYKRHTINASISCDNADTVQICDNYLIFKYFDRVYLINASDLSNDVVKVTSINDRVLSKSQDVSIPWDDNSCISESDQNHYALIWKEKYSIDSKGELFLEHPGMRVKLFYKMYVEYPDKTQGMPWLRDESRFFNTDFIIYIKGKPVYLYNNLLLTFYDENYEDLGERYEWKIHLKGTSLEYPNVSKIVQNVLLYYHRGQNDAIDFKFKLTNEAGHILIDTSDKKESVLDLKTFSTNDKVSNEKFRLDTTIVDTKVINAGYMFPCLVADAYISGNNKGQATFCSVTYQYTTIDRPDQDQYDLYQDVIRIREVEK